MFFLKLLKIFLLHKIIYQKKTIFTAKAHRMTNALLVVFFIVDGWEDLVNFDINNLIFTLPSIKLKEWIDYVKIKFSCHA
jgi:hypothetical protein